MKVLCSGAKIQPTALEWIILRTMEATASLALPAILSVLTLSIIKLVQDLYLKKHAVLSMKANVQRVDVFGQAMHVLVFARARAELMNLEVAVQLVTRIV